MSHNNYMDHIQDTLVHIEDMVEKGYDKYGMSCLSRGPIGLFFMLSRKWDRIEKALEENGYDYMAAIKANPGPDGLEDDIEDLMAYLTILSSDVAFRNGFEPGTQSFLKKEAVDTEEEGMAAYARKLDQKAASLGTKVNHPSPFGYEEEDEVVPLRNP